MIKILFTAFICVLSVPAHAIFEICNKSSTHAMEVAWASELGLLLQSDFRIQGWYHIEPDRCEIVSYEDVFNRSIWVHAVSNNIILTLGSRQPGVQLWDSDRKFCLSDTAISLSGNGPGVTGNCASDHYLAPFPVSTWFDTDTVDFTLEMNPDEFMADVNQQAAPANGRPTLPDLHGAVFISATDVYYASIYKGSAEEARQDALDYCNASEAEAGCTLNAAFKNQCYAAAGGPTTNLSLTGLPDWTEQQTIDSLLLQCSEANGAPCQKIISACSTYAARAAQQQQETQQGKQDIIDWMINSIGPLFQAQ